MTAFTPHNFDANASIMPTITHLAAQQPFQPSAQLVTLAQGLEVQGLSVAYRSLIALDKISFSLPMGQLVGVIGPNGAGKSTLIKAMLGLVPSNQMLMTLAGKPLRQQLQRIAYVPQRSQIDWQYPATVWDVVLMGRVRQTGWLRSFTPTSRHVALAALERVGMAAFRDRSIGELSGGQQQRVFLARALAQEADVFFLDEPFVGVDQKTQTVLFEIFHQLAEAGKLVLVVNHDLGTAITHFDQLLILNRSLIAAGPRQTVFRAEILRQAYQGNVIFFEGEAA
jgi:manganese/iron transport system ATP-binding protein